MYKKKFSYTLLISIFLGLIIAQNSFCQNNGLQVKVFTPQHGDARSLYSMLKGLLSPQGKISLDSRTNSVVVIDTPQTIKDLSSVTQQLSSYDNPVSEKQVEIKVLIAEVTDAFMNELGISGGSIVIPAGKYQAVLRALNTSRNARISSQTMIRTTSNQPASLQVSADALMGSTIVRYPDGREVTTIDREQIGDFLEVLPVVNNNSSITVSVHPSKSSLQNNGTSKTSSLSTQVVINDGDTIAIGGVDTIREETRDEKVFGIPVSKQSSRKQNKTMMFLTATIVQ